MLKRCNRLKSKISRLVVYRFGTAKIVNKHSKYFLHIPVTYDVPESQISDICNVVGIDRGVNFVVATYDSRHKSGFIRGRTIKQKKILLKTAQGTPIEPYPICKAKSESHWSARKSLAAGC